jgi:hypothetical protein
LQRANEHFLGRESTGYGPKLPARLLDPSLLRLDAPLIRILSETLAFCAEKGWLDLQ